MNGRYLLDTNIVVDLLENEVAVRERLAAADEVYVPVVALGVLYYGARKSARPARNIARIDEFAAYNPVVNCDLATAQQFGQVKIDLRSRGRPIPENDMWIAAIALQHNLTLVTRDSHFQVVTGLRTEAW